MKLIIDIPDNAYKQNRCFYDNVYHAIPFDSVIEEEKEKLNDIAFSLLSEVENYEKAIEDIKAEINECYHQADDIAYAEGLEMAELIIDKYIADMRKE